MATLLSLRYFFILYICKNTNNTVGIQILLCMYVYFISKSVNILYNTTQEYILYNIIQR